MGRTDVAHERGLLRAYLATGAEAATGLHRGVAVDAPALELRPRDREILMVKAGELMSRPQRAAVDVPLPDGRRVTLVSRPMASASGVQGSAVEAVGAESGLMHRRWSPSLEPRSRSMPAR